MARQCMLSTIDNPFNPFKSFDDWLRFDKDNEYNSAELLARIAYPSEQLTDDELNDEIERAIDDIIVHDPLNIYVKVITE